MVAPSPPFSMHVSEKNMYKKGRRSGLIPEQSTFNIGYMMSPSGISKRSEE